MKRVLLALALAGCAADVEIRETKGEVREPSKFPHEIWTGVLAKVNTGGFIDYKGLIADPADFDEYLGYLAKYSPDATPGLFPTRADKMAYYINAYNAYTMKQVTDRYPIASVKDTTIPNEFWVGHAFPLGPEQTFTLAQIEGKLRDMGDPRVHFAINCASKGCPRLPEEAFVPQRLEDQLARETRRFVNEERNVQVDGGTARVSSIFKWYAKDFREWQATNGQPDDIRAYIKGAGRDVPAGAKIEYLDYDWGLNEQEATR